MFGWWSFYSPARQKHLGGGSQYTYQTKYSGRWCWSQYSSAHQLQRSHPNRPGTLGFPNLVNNTNVCLQWRDGVKFFSASYPLISLRWTIKSIFDFSRVLGIPFFSHHNLFNGIEMCRPNLLGKLLWLQRIVSQQNWKVLRYFLRFSQGSTIYLWHHWSGNWRAPTSYFGDDSSLCLVSEVPNWGDPPIGRCNRSVTDIEESWQPIGLNKLANSSHHLSCRPAD